MGIVNMLGSMIDINKGVEEWKRTEGAVLVDVRTASEYKAGHIPGSINVPLDQILGITQYVEDKSTPLFLYCRSGNRSGKAAGYVRSLGYTSITNIGGISSYTGEIEK